jgi:hypothetical protein
MLEYFLTDGHKPYQTDMTDERTDVSVGQMP